MVEEAKLIHTKSSKIMKELDREEQEFRMRTQILTGLLKASKAESISQENHLREVVSIYIEWEKVRLHEQRDENFARNAAYTAARLSLLWRINDSDIVGQILHFIFQRDKNFAIFFWWHFSGLSYVVTVAGNIFKIASIQDEQSLKSLQFFLEHATASQCTFHGHRFVNFPLPSPFNVSATAMSLIHLQNRHLLLLLQYGGNMFPFHPNMRTALALRQLVFYTWIGIGRKTFERDNLINLICLGQINRIIWDVAISFDDEELLEVIKERTIEDIKICADIILKIVPQLRPRDLEITSSQYYLFSSVEQTFSKKVQIEKYSEWNIKATQFITRLRRLATQISPLKHLCRCSIRNWLNENFQLPRGVSELPLSPELKDYINLIDTTT